MRRLFDERARIVTQRASPAMDRSEYFERVCRGGYPEVNELVRQASRQLDPPVTLHHYRTRDRAEVDVIAEAADGRIVAIEVKSGRTADRGAFRALASLRERVDRAGGRFVRGVVLYLGDGALPAGDRLAALPLSHLWASPSRS